MPITYPAFDEAFEKHFRAVWQFCFLLTASVRDAEDLTFRAFLVLGAAKNAESKAAPDEARTILYDAAVQLTQHYYTQKPRRRPTRRRLEESRMPLEISDSLLDFLRRSLSRRTAALLQAAGFGTDAAARMMHLPQCVVRFLYRHAVPIPGLDGIEPAEGLDRGMSGRIYDRFSERSVGFENSVHKAGRTFERIAPWLALIVIAFLVAAWFYAERLR